MSNVFERIYSEVKKIPKGETASYGEIANIRSRGGEPVPPARWRKGGKGGEVGNRRPLFMIGANVSAVGGLPNTFIQARTWQIETCQTYIKPSRSWKGELPSEKLIADFKKERRNSPVKIFVAHSAIIHNPASRNSEVRRKTVEAVKLELGIANALGVETVVLHCGYGPLELLIQSLSEVLDNYQGDTCLLLENMAGQKGSLGSDVGQIKKVLSAVSGEPALQSGRSLSVCLDTCHLFAAGYDVRKEKTWRELRKIFGGKIRALHVNDSKSEIGSGLDRHERLGKGKIGLAGFELLVNFPAFKNLPLILENPDPATMTIKNLEILRKIINNPVHSITPL